MDELLEQFLIEGRELVAQAGRDLASLTRAPGDRAATDSLFRAIHTLKGSVAIFALAPAERLLHAAEDLLDHARRDAGLLGEEELRGLTACIDQTDRWIDDMEREGRLPDDAPEQGEHAAALLTKRSASAGAVAAPVDVAQPADWVATLMERERAVIDRADRPLTAFRYSPDADCFFRGEDPLAVVEGVPELLAFAVLPAGAAWPAAGEIEPFACFSRLEGLSAAPSDAVRAAFRMQPDQVLFAPIAAGAVPERRAQGRSETNILRVEAARVDAMADDLGDLIVAVNALTLLADEAQERDSALAARIRAAQASIEGVAGKLHRTIGAVRLVPLQPALRRLPRLAREIASSLGKDVTLTISGERIEVDKQIADGIFEPLLHLLRNAIDHGIESPARRAAMGKPPGGRVTLDFRREGGTVTATLRDDGGGMDPAAIRRVAAARGLISAESADALSDAAALRLIFLPGFSTAREVTGISGRGVGMDAVQAAVEAMRGTIEIESLSGKGALFRLHLPANALTTRLLVVDVAGERYGVALDQVVETVRIERSALMPVGGGLACVLRDRTIPVLDLASLLGSQPSTTPHAKLVVTRSGGEPVALRVDGFAERIDTVVRPSSGILAAARGVIGSALLGDGGVLLVLDLPELAA